MSLRFKTSTDAAYTTIIGDMDAVTPKYTYETDLLPDLIKFTLESTTAWGSNKNVLLDVDDTAKREVIVKNFVNAELDLSMSDQATVTVDGAEHPMAARDGLYVGRGSKAITFASDSHDHRDRLMPKSHGVRLRTQLSNQPHQPGVRSMPRSVPRAASNP